MKLVNSLLLIVVVMISAYGNGEFILYGATNIRSPLYMSMNGVVYRLMICCWPALYIMNEVSTARMYINIVNLRLSTQAVQLILFPIGIAAYYGNLNALAGTGCILFMHWCLYSIIIWAVSILNNGNIEMARKKRSFFGFIITADMVMFAFTFLLWPFVSNKIMIPIIKVSWLFTTFMLAIVYADLFELFVALRLQ